MLTALFALPPPAHAMALSRQVAAEAPVTAVDLEHVRSNNSPAVAVDPTDPRFVVAASRVDLPAFDCSLGVSYEGGRSWLPARPVPRLPAGADRCYAPEVAFDGEGVLYYLFSGLQGPANTPMGVFLSTSSNQGRSFSPPRRVLGGDNFSVRMAIARAGRGRDRIHIVWLHTSAPPTLGGLPPVTNPILASHSDDRGQTWSAPVPVSDPWRERVVAPALAVGAGGRVHVAYLDLGRDAIDYQGLEGPTWDEPWTLVASDSADGEGFSPGVVVDPGVVPPERVLLVFTMPPPSLVADAHGAVLVAWADARNGDWDVFVRGSEDGGGHWGGPVRLNDDPVGNGRQQYLPRLAMAPGGRVDAIFYDRRSDPENTHNDVFFTSSADGRTFSPNLRLTSEASSSLVGPTYPIPSAAGRIDFGSRLALASTDHAAIAAWTDTRNSLPGEQQDIFATRVTLSPEGPPEATSTAEGDSREAPFGAVPGAVLGGLLLLASALGHMRRRPRGGGGSPLIRAAGVGGMAVVVLAGCSSDSIPRRPQRMDVTMTEYRFGYRSDLRPGRIVVRARNVGREDHELVLVALPRDFPLDIDRQLHSSERRAFPTRAYLPRRGPGRSGIFAVDLNSGRYALICFVRGPDGQPHALEGMSSEFRVA